MLPAHLAPTLSAALDQIHTEAQALFGQGRVADYIPALARVPPRQFGINLMRTF